MMLVNTEVTNPSSNHPKFVPGEFSTSIRNIKKEDVNSFLKPSIKNFLPNPNILLEVACLKKFIISTNCKLGPKQILQSGKGGILYKVGDYNKLYLILKKINLNSKETKKKIINSYNYVQNNFEKDVSKPFIEIMKEL